MTLIKIREEQPPEITNLVEYLKLRRRVESVSSTLVKQAEDMVKALHAAHGTLPTSQHLWDRLIARAIEDERALEGSKTENK